MHPTIERHLDEIIALRNEYGVIRLEIFGSAVTGEFDLDRSDFDFLVEYPEGHDFGPWGSGRLELRDRLEALFGLKVDLIIPKNLRNPYVIRSINESRRLLYAA